MTPGVWPTIFLGISLAIIAVAAWMAWFAKKAIREHRQQVQGILEEMRAEIEKAGH